MPVRPSRLTARALWSCTWTLLLLVACGTDPAVRTLEDQTASLDADPTDSSTEPGTDATVFELPPATCQPGSGGAGCECASNGDCQQNFCIETPDGKQCARTCTEDCPTGFACNTVSGPGGDTLSICVPRYGRLCNPCTESGDCAAIGVPGGACVSYGPLGRFCGSPCQKNADCSGGFACKTVQSAEGQDVKQCIALADTGDGPGECSCSKLASDQGLKTTCAVTVKDKDGKVLGQCPGVRTCGAGGLSECVAPDAKAEVCDGVDNDCNGQTDEGTCEDLNPCTQDTCAPQLAGNGKEGCVHDNLQKPCDADGSVCTQNDQCVGGICKAGLAKVCDDDNPCTKDVCDPSAGCTQTADDGVACSDGNLCTLGDVCKGGSCVKGKPMDCDVGKPCVLAACDLATGGCTFTNKPEGLDCDDGKACTELDTCKTGICQGKVKNCDDGNGCTYEACDPNLGCKYVNSTTSCDDGNACTTGDACKDGICAAKAVSCDDANACTQDSCDPKLGCAHQTASIPCSDGNACSVGDLCKDGSCIAGVQKSCDDNSPCSVDSCDTVSGLCVYDGSAFEGAACNADDSVCTVGDKCAGGKCLPGKPKNCDDNNPCTDDECDAVKGCQKQPNTAPCDADNNACTVGDQCKDGNCTTGKDKGCDDGNLCTADSCNPATGGCEHTGTLLNGKPCDYDGSVCTVSDACKDGKCAPGKPKPCDDGNVCTDDGCEPVAGCTNVFNADPCDDGAACTVGDACASGKCLAGKAKVCDDKNGCTFDSCNVATGACVYDTKALEGSACDADGSVCTDKDKCAGGKCSVGSALPCDDGNACTSDTCDAKLGCQFTNNTAACNDGNACTGNDTCGSGKCVGSAVSCDDGNACTTDSCDPVQGCVHKGLAEGSLCGTDQVCGGGVCKPAVCGDGVIQGAVEKCDGVQLAGATCSTVLGTGSDGTLGCAAGCKAYDATGCNVDLSWMDMSDDCKGFRLAKQYTNVHFAVAKVTTWDKAKNYQCPKGHHAATSSEAKALFVNNAPQEFVYNGLCGWVGDQWGGQTRKYFRFADSATTNLYKHVGEKEGTPPSEYSGVDFFAGIVCIADK